MKDFYDFSVRNRDDNMLSNVCLASGSFLGLNKDRDNFLLQILKSIFFWILCSGF